jgi:hypothetical protein
MRNGGAEAASCWCISLFPSTLKLLKNQATGALGEERAASSDQASGKSQCEIQAIRPHPSMRAKNWNRTDRIFGDHCDRFPSRLYSGHAGRGYTKIYLIRQYVIIQAGSKWNPHPRDKNDNVETEKGLTKSS